MPIGIEADYKPDDKSVTNKKRICPECGEASLKEVRGGRTNTNTTFSVELQCMNFGVCSNRKIYEVHVPYVELPKSTGQS